VLGAEIDPLAPKAAQDRILSWGRKRESRYVVLANAHVVVSASQDAAFGQVVNGADMATPDGAPVAWMVRKLGYPAQPRVSGPDLTWELLKRCADGSLPVYFFGSSRETLDALASRITAAFPDLLVAGFEAPPFRAMTEAEDTEAVDRINGSGAGLVFVGLGCPKQEHWMAAHRGRINAVMLGVGAAFDFHAGTVSRAPAWMRDHGLEWLHRLWSEPRRLWKRYLVTNTLFVLGAARQLLGMKFR
jgi:N-acetylglucosaminyldiphosphoundecaprenol N-acetyl-beta-D-mannosaminyltransferase